MRLIKKILPAIVDKNYQGQCDSEGGEKLMKKVRTLFATIKVKVEIVMNAMTKRTAIRFCRLKDLAYLFKHKNRINVSPQHMLLFYGDTFVRKKK